jgi:plasmid stabilization system protein ParE
VARVTYTLAAVQDLERLADFLLQDDPPAATNVLALVTEAIEVLAKHPLVGRATPDNVREQVISRGKSGYLALYDFEPNADLIVVLGVRQQREAGYSDPSDPD